MVGEIQLHLHCTITIYLQKKLYSIKTHKKNKVSHIPPIVEKDKIITGPKEKADVFNNFFASKSSVQGANDPPPVLPPLENIFDIYFLLFFFF